MTEQAKFQQSVNVLAKAYHAGLLHYGSCTQCAVGTLIGNAHYLETWHQEETGGDGFLLYDGSVADAAWYSKMINRGYASFDEGGAILAEAQRESIGYDWHEIQAIENGFENGRGESNLLYPGVVGAVRALANIHRIDGTGIELALAQFVDKSKTTN